MNIAEGKKNFASDSTSALLTGLTGVFLSIFRIINFAYLNGGYSFVLSLPKNFSLGGEPSLTTYLISLLIEGICFAAIVTMLLLFYWNNKLTTD
jgi:hypothetical protein